MILAVAFKKDCTGASRKYVVALHHSYNRVLTQGILHRNWFAHHFKDNIFSMLIQSVKVEIRNGKLNVTDVPLKFMLTWSNAYLLLQLTRLLLRPVEVHELNLKNHSIQN